MKRAAAVSFALLFGSIALAAQTASHSQTIIVRLPAGTSVCPVSVHAQQAAGGETLAVKNARPKGVAQLLHLILTNPDSGQIVAAKVTVHGLTAKGRLTQTLSNQDDSSDAARTLDVTFAAGPGKDVSADLWTPGLSAVKTIDLNSVTYGDGSTWKLAAGMTCRTLIDATMLIGNR
ncbi:MAG TPA: hypothetical protein VGE83_10925 [Terracidiphilus sp.]